MYGALPPGAWWEVANGAEPVVEPYADKAGDAAVLAAREGDLELMNVSFAYPLRKDMAGKSCSLGRFWTLVMGVRHVASDYIAVLC